jgi:hypothetical protein
MSTYPAPGTDGSPLPVRELDRRRLAPTGRRFLIRSRLFTDQEYADLGETPASRVGAQIRP